MAWYWHKRSATILGILLAAGCSGSRAIPLVPSDLPRNIAEQGTGDNVSSVRSQKPEMDNAVKQVVDLRPDKPASVLGEKPAARAIALVNNQTIFESELNMALLPQMYELSQLPEPDRSRRLAEANKAALDQLVDREVVLMNAQDFLKKINPKALEKLQEVASKEFEKSWVRPMQKRVGAKTEEEFKTFLQSQNIDLAMQKRTWERNFMAMEYLRNRVSSFVDQVGHFQVQEYYDKHPEDFQVPDSVEWLDLFLSTTDPKHPTPQSVKALADSIVVQLRHGDKFLQFKNMDNGDSSLRECKGEGKRRGEIRPPEAEALLFSMKDGDAAVIEMDRGCHVIQLVKRQHAGLLPFDDKVQKQVRDKLKGEVMQREMKRLVAQWRREAIIIYPKDGK